MAKGELQEKDFIQERKGNGGFKLWLVGLIIIALFGFLWLLVSQFIQTRNDQVEKNPFLQVTNREISLFLWQFPEYMRAHSSKKTGYLPGFFSQGKVTIRPEQADEYVQAPPDVIFHYHVWDRLIKDEFISRPIPVDEFREFLKSTKQWLPDFWSEAPDNYVLLVQKIQNNEEEEKVLTKADLPLDVRIAFQGWKNYYKEGDEINKVQPNISQVKQFLNESPNYNRNYWRNLYPDYLKTMLQESSKDQEIPTKEFPAFLRAAYYNFQQTI